MKKKLALLLILLLCAGLLAACSGGTEPEPVADAPEPTYKDIMVPFDQLASDNRIVILQNTLNFGYEGFYTEATKPVAEEINYQGATVAAYPITYALGFLNQGSAGTVNVFDTAGVAVEYTAADFAACYVILEFDSGLAPVLFNPADGSEIAAFAYALTSEGEAIYSIVADSVHPTADILTAVGWDVAQPYRYVATDKFYITVPVEENTDGELRGTLSGAINGSFPILSIASGKINDIVFIEAVPAE